MPSGTDDFADRVVIITGAGRGRGAAYARFLAGRGARIVVNDLGTDVYGEGSSAGPADDVVADLLGVGGDAIANHDDIATEAGANHLVEQGCSTTTTRS